MKKEFWYFVILFLIIGSMYKSCHRSSPSYQDTSDRDARRAAESIIDKRKAFEGR